MVRQYGTAFLALFLGLTSAGALLAQGQGRLAGTVVDENGNPVQGVEVTITNELTGYHSSKKTDKKGRFTVIFINATVPYQFELVKDGYRTVKEGVRPKPLKTTKKEFEMPSLQASASEVAAEQQAEAQQAAPTHDPVIKNFNEGVTAYQSGDLTTAEERFRKAVELKPDLAEGYSALAGVLLDEKKYDDAAQAAEKLLELDPQNVRGLEMRYDAYQGAGDEAKAKEALTALEAVDTGENAAVRVYNEGAEAARMGDVKRAQERFLKAVELNPNLGAAHFALAALYLRQQKFADAAQEAEKAAAMDASKKTDALKIRYEAYRGLGDQAKAQEAFQDLAAADPKAVGQALYEKGVELFNGGKAEQAKDDFEKALAADPSIAKAHYMLGLCYVNTGESAKAKEHLQKFIQMAPDDADASSAKEMLKYLG